jgi:hypothetical protein
MKVNDYAHARKFKNFCAKLNKECTKRFGKPDKYIVDTNIYLFLFEKESFKLCIDSSEAYCHPNDPDIYFRLVYHSSDGSIHLEELDPVTITKCDTISKKCRSLIRTASHSIHTPRVVPNARDIVVILSFYYAFLYLARHID